MYVNAWMIKHGNIARDADNQTQLCHIVSTFLASAFLIVFQSQIIQDKGQHGHALYHVMML